MDTLTPARWTAFMLIAVMLSSCGASGSDLSPVTEAMLEGCRAAVIDRISGATAETVYLEDRAQTPPDQIVVQWRMTTATVSGACVFDKTGAFLEFIRQ
ncbi:MAG: hypothetical protein AAF766_20070 [Cyanobacteria bacterium P01_D01_bin.14]